MSATVSSVVTAPGFHYTTEFLSVEEEKEFLTLVDSMPFRTIKMRGEIARRTVRLFWI